MTENILLILGIYLLLTVGLGICARAKSTQTAEDYFLASRSVSWGHLALTIFATWFSTFAFLGAPGFVYQKGVSWFWVMGTFLLVAPLLGWFLGRKLWLLGRANGYVTPADLLADFYDSQVVRYLVALVCVFALLPYSLIQLVGIGKVIAASTDGVLSYEMGVLMAASAILLYTFFGGVRAIIWTDVIQGILFFAVILFGTYAALDAAGGFSIGLQRSIATRPEAFVVQTDSIGSLLTLMIIWSFGFVLLPHLWQRSYMARSAESLAKSLVLFSFLSLALVLGTFAMGALGIGFIGELSDSDTFVPTLYAEHIPWALPLLVLATFAAGMSTVDSQLLTASSIVARDFVDSSRAESLSPRAERTLGQLTVIALIVILTVLALMPESRGAIIPLASKGTAVCLLLLVPLCGPFFFQHASKQSAIWSLIGGASVMLVLELELWDVGLPYGFGPAVAALISQSMIFLIINFATRSR